ncbi:Acetophenone carboxylase beta subunit [uncultured Desulfatiglans sp.]|uniref:Acetophenone carboxylase beta subunit n=1 Tax=Uncultured Desulfatiglans sp. TaxID=1748965 RepID=A0A653AHM5_UNCDX|nr:Acetophenone carboxylase beta subunit [uncultured Desulfatiglans sp.]
MGDRIRMTEYLDLDLGEEQWYCSACGKALIGAAENYKRGCLVYARDPKEVHNAVYEGEYTFAPDPNWVRILEFYCPGCGVQIETEYLPLGHPITHDIAIDLAGLKSRIESGELRVVNKRLEVKA